MKTIGVDCRFRKDGTVRIRRIQQEDGWVSMEQGRQWLDSKGRHVLIRPLDGTIMELVLDPETLTWRCKKLGDSGLEIV